jgi:hypothetical protein
VGAHSKAVAGGEGCSLDTSVTAALVSGAGAWVPADCYTDGGRQTHLSERYPSRLVAVQASEHGVFSGAAFAA